jgi:endoglucanase
MRSAISAIIFSLLIVDSSWSNPPKLATFARLDVEAEPAVGRLDGGVNYGGYLSRMTWLGSGIERTYSALTPILYFAWREVNLVFTPQSNGFVNLTIDSAWEWSAESNAVFKQEVDWDSLSADAAFIPNPSFESLAGGEPLHWTHPWGGAVLITNVNYALDGTHVARVWSERPLRTQIHVTGGVPVRIRGHARAVLPEGFVDQAPILDAASPAHVHAQRFMRGVNLANVFEAPAGDDWGGGPLADADLDAVAAQGFDHIRVPARWDDHTGPAPAYAISNAFFAEVNAVVTGALARGLGVILNVHHFDEFFADPPAWTNKLFAIWDQLARTYSNQPPSLAFELLNEPHSLSTAALNDLYAALIRRIRQHAPDRPIFVEPGDWGSNIMLPLLRLPANDSNIIVSIHFYEPMPFTHQGAPWIGNDVATTNVVYPGPPPSETPRHPLATSEAIVAWFQAYHQQPPDRNPCSAHAFISTFDFMKAWSDYYGRPLHVGEFGAIQNADLSSRARFLRDIRDLCDRRGLGWAVWDWKAFFAYWDRDAHAPLEGLRDALFPAPALRINGTPPTIASDLARSKKIHVQYRLPTQEIWSTVASTQLATPALIWHPPPEIPAALVRILWDYSLP